MQRFRILSIVAILILVIASLPVMTVFAGANVEAENYSARSSTAVGAVGGTDGVAVVSLGARPNEWTSYNNQDLASTSINLRYANAYAATTLEVRSGTSTGTLLGTCNLPLTGSWTTYTTSTCALSGAGGSGQTLVLVFKDLNYVYINWFNLGGTTPVATATLTATRTNTSTGPIATATQTLTATRTNTATGPTATATRTATITNTAVGPTATPTRTPTITATSGAPSANIEAENYSARSSTAVGAVGSTDGSAATILAARPNEWTTYNNLNLTSTSINLRYSNAYAAATVEVRAGTSTGTLLGTCNLPLTGGWTTYVTAACSLNGAGSTNQALVLVFTGNNYAYFNWFNLSGGGPTMTPSKTSTPTQTAIPPLGSKRIVGYYPAWGVYGANYHVKNIDTSGSAAKLTHINYAFINVINNRCSLGVTALNVGDAWADYSRTNDASLSIDGVADVGNQPLRGNFNQLKKLKVKYPALKVVASLGGWTWSDGFFSAARPENRVAFVSSCVDGLIRGNLPVYDGAGGTGAAAGVFDGIDIDWEYPGLCGLNPSCGATPADTANFTALLAEFRSQLDAQGAIDGKHYLLTAAMPAGIDKIVKINIPGVNASLDYINLMTYDFFGSWAAQGPTAHQSALYAWTGMPSTSPVNSYYSDAAVNAWINGGVQPSHLTLGVPFYGRGWTNVTNANNGMNQPANGAAPGDPNLGEGMQSYKYLKALGWPGFRDTQAQANWIFNGTTFWTFDDPLTLQTKMTYVKNRGLGGAMLWELSNDTTDGELITALFNGLK